MNGLSAIFTFLILILFLPVSNVLACPQCRAQTKSTIYNENFYGNFLVMALPVLVVAACGIALFYWGEISKLRAKKNYGEK